MVVRKSEQKWGNRNFYRAFLTGYRRFDINSGIRCVFDGVFEYKKRLYIQPWSTCIYRLIVISLIDLYITPFHVVCFVVLCLLTLVAENFFDAFRNNKINIGLGGVFVHNTIVPNQINIYLIGLDLC